MLLLLIIKIINIAVFVHIKDFNPIKICLHVVMQTVEAAWNAMLLNLR